MSVLINITTTPLNEKHICFFTEIDCTSKKWKLRQIVECYYEHPDSDGRALISQIETRTIKTLIGNHQSALKLLQNAQDNIYNIIND